MSDGARHGRQAPRAPAPCELARNLPHPGLSAAYITQNKINTIPGQPQVMVTGLQALSVGWPDWDELQDKETGDQEVAWMDPWQHLGTGWTGGRAGDTPPRGSPASRGRRPQGGEMRKHRGVGAVCVLLQVIGQPQTHVPRRGRHKGL